MRIHCSQLIPGCVLIKSVKGKSSQPIVPEKTILTEEHIAFLHAFLVDQVDVHATLADGNKFIPEKNIDTLAKEHRGLHKENKNSGAETDNMSPIALYQHAVKEYGELFDRWQGNIPVEPLEIRKMAKMLMEHLDEFAEMIISLPDLSTDDAKLSHHNVSLCIMSAYLSKKMGLSKKEVLQISIAGLLCDAGLARLPNMLALYGEHEDEVQFRQHPVYSYRMIEKVTGLHHLSKLAVLQHHERLDGNGYPIGLSGEKLHIFSKIIAVCDTFYGLRQSMPDESPYKLMENMKRDEFTKLDPMIMKKMMQSFSDLSVGNFVQLSSSEQAEVIFKEPNAPTRPIVNVVNSKEIIALIDHPSIYIEKTLKRQPSMANE